MVYHTLVRSCSPNLPSLSLSTLDCMVIALTLCSTICELRVVVVVFFALLQMPPPFVYQEAEVVFTLDTTEKELLAALEMANPPVVLTEIDLSQVHDSVCILPLCPQRRSLPALAAS